MQSSYYTEKELLTIGFKSIGSSVLVSRKTSIYAPEKISICNNVRIDDFCILSGGVGIILHNHIHIAAYSALIGGAGIEMEDFSGVSMRCNILSESDEGSGKSMVSPLIPLKYKPGFKSGKIIFKKHSGLGINCTVLPEICLAEGSIIAPHSLLMHNTEAWFIYMGVPARKLHSRKKDILELEKDFLKAYNKT